jgi:GH15 family glucan-1,4-alpha-glucosidase
MCWAACDRLSRIAARLGLGDRSAHWAGEAARIRKVILEQAWSEKRGSLVGSFGNDHLDASLLTLADLGFVEPQDPRFLGTIAAIEKELRRGPYVFRYMAEDDFGAPETAFNICTFWYINALASVDRRDEARELFENMLDKRTSLGLLSEDLDVATGELWGNFPQTYSMVGIISAATRLSRTWEESL